MGIQSVGIQCLSAGILFADVGCAPISRLPNEGELVPTDYIRLGLGGCASNVAMDLATLNVDVGVSGCVGDDFFGKFVTDALTVPHIDTQGIHRVSNSDTACTMITNVAGQDRRFISNPGANREFTVDHIPKKWVRQAKVFYVGGFLILPGLETDAMVSLFREARQAGVKTVLDVVLFSGGEFWAPIERLLPETDFFLPNDDEAAVLTGLRDPLEQALRFRDAGAGTVVITRGAQGATLVSEKERLQSAVYPTNFVGGAGSGDAFDAGFIAGLIWGETPAGCLRWGSALGASCVRSIDTTESVFTRNEAEAFLAEHELPIEAL